ncbi:hypothetical protein ITP53_08375 [Nonomuraea sp. K274]|uniref:Uncharacterized protein n=2 Tax=Nonomuraea cypriaca TaxID=1187855 RepID=A0A931A9C0_9ACTN|nr:hypothetical protein [Nonomuraea cypriaca]
MTGPQQTLPSSQRDLKRPLLWLLLMISAVGNVVANTYVNGFVGAGFGLAAMGCAAALISRHRKGRRDVTRP